MLGIDRHRNGDLALRHLELVALGLGVDIADHGVFGNTRSRHVAAHLAQLGRRVTRQQTRQPFLGYDIGLIEGLAHIDIARRDAYLDAIATVLGQGLSLDLFGLRADRRAVNHAEQSSEHARDQTDGDALALVHGRSSHGSAGRMPVPPLSGRSERKAAQSRSWFSMSNQSLTKS